MKTSGLTAHEMRAIIGDRVHEEENQAATAHGLGISPQYLSDILRGRREPSQTVASALGYDRVTIYVKR